ncbi:MAG: UPF0280 family protein [Syntrophomonas sp.]
MNDDQNGVYEKRYYRFLHEGGDLKYFHIKIKETDLAIGVDAENYTDSLLSLCRHEVIRLRKELENYIEIHPHFLVSFVPLELLPAAPEIAVRMGKAASLAGVGPMAAVAGAIAQAVGEILRKHVEEVMVENGGDIYIDSSKERIIAVFAGKSRFSYKIGIRVKTGESPLGICTSSGTVGPSFSFGRADAAVIKGFPTELADAVATRAGNLVKTEDDLIKAVEYAKNIKGVTGILLIKGEKMAAWGDIELVPIRANITN